MYPVVCELPQRNYKTLPMGASQLAILIQFIQTLSPFVEEKYSPLRKVCLFSFVSNLRSEWFLLTFVLIICAPNLTGFPLYNLFRILAWEPNHTARRVLDTQFTKAGYNWLGTFNSVGLMHVPIRPWISQWGPVGCFPLCSRRLTCNPTPSQPASKHMLLVWKRAWGWVSIEFYLA